MYEPDDRRLLIAKVILDRDSLSKRRIDERGEERERQGRVEGERGEGEGERQTEREREREGERE